MERHAGFYALFTVAAVIVLIVSRSFDDDGNFSVGSSYRAEAPATVIAADGSEEVLVRPSSGGSFISRAVVDGAEVNVLIDTGASYLTLRQSDAEKAGIYLSPDDFVNTFSTANGKVMAARAQAENVDFGPGRLENVTVFILPDDKLEISLLGMNVLRRFGSVSFNSDGLTISVE